jgi:hypothetical protein
MDEESDQEDDVKDHDYMDEELVRESRYDDEQVGVQESAGDEGDVEWSVALDWFEDAPKWELSTKNRGRFLSVGVILCHLSTPLSQAIGRDS